MGRTVRTASDYSECSLAREGALGSAWSLASVCSGVIVKSGVSATSAVSMLEKDIARVKRLLAEKD